MRDLMPRKPDAFWPDLEEWLAWPFSWRPPIPAVDIEETDDAYIVTAELPGFDKKDIEIELHNNVLTLRGEKVDREGRRFLRRERAKSVARFERQFRFGADIDHDRVTAEFKQGELVITLPKAQGQKARTIPVR
ncbi:MAG: Hsp20/alpha crystallin family protein [Firmicutes bacterium]|nr:Hsp20/alpha crystallin family protein [Bacillota bacterium]